MFWPALFKTLLLCSISILLEAAAATKRGKNWFEQLRRPPYSFGLKVWYIVGAVYYLIFGTIAYRRFAAGDEVFSAPVVLLAAVFIANGLANIILFRYYSLKWFYLVIYPFSLLVILLLMVLVQTGDTVSALLAALYLAWLAYDLYYLYHLWKLNENQDPPAQVPAGKR